jgi:hypothetical protein
MRKTIEPVKSTQILALLRRISYDLPLPRLHQLLPHDFNPHPSDDKMIKPSNRLPLDGAPRES